MEDVDEKRDSFQEPSEESDEQLDEKTVAKQVSFIDTQEDAPAVGGSDQSQKADGDGDGEVTIVSKQPSMETPSEDVKDSQFSIEQKAETPVETSKAEITEQDQSEREVY